jgi:hypothetical protein
MLRLRLSSLFFVTIHTSGFCPSIAFVGRLCQYIQNEKNPPHSPTQRKLMKIMQGHKKSIVYTVIGVTALIVLTVSAAAFHGSVGETTVSNNASPTSTPESTFAVQAQGQPTVTSPAQTTTTPKPVPGASTQPKATQYPVTVATPYKNPYACDEGKKAQVEQQLSDAVNAENTRHAAGMAMIQANYPGDTTSAGYHSAVASEEAYHSHQYGVIEINYEQSMNAIYCKPHQ